MVNKRIRKIIKELIERLKHDKNIVSITLVGSFADDNKKLEKFNDIDLVLILKELKSKDVIKLKRLGKYLKKKFSTKKTGITCTLKIGPIKVVSEKQKTMMLHFLVYPEKEYTKYESSLTRYSFQNYKPLLGKPLKEINEVKFVKKNDLFNDIDGIPTMKEWIKTKSAEYVEPTEKGIKIKPLKLTNKQYEEIIIYSVLRLASNMLRILGEKSDTNSKTYNQFRKVYPIKLKDLPLKTLKLKGKLRKGKKLSENERKELQKKALEFINQCETILTEKIIT